MIWIWPAAYKYVSPHDRGVAPTAGREFHLLPHDRGVTPTAGREKRELTHMRRMHDGIVVAITTKISASITNGNNVVRTICMDQRVGPRRSTGRRVAATALGRPTTGRHDW